MIFAIITQIMLTSSNKILIQIVMVIFVITPYTANHQADEDKDNVGDNCPKKVYEDQSNFDGYGDLCDNCRPLT